MKNRRTVTLTKKHLNELETHACGTYPEEACALLVGTITVDMDYHISEVILSPNVAENKNQFFEIDPAVRIRLERHLRDKEHQVIGVYHSHPDGEAKPSETDARMIIEPDLVWIISSVDVQQKLITNAFLPAVTEGFTEMTIQHKKKRIKKMTDPLKINFASDNAAPVCPQLMDALIEENNGPALGYGNDATTERMQDHLRELFNHDLRAFPVATGTAANVLALSVLTPPYGSVYCHKVSHIQEDECGAPEFYTGGAKLALLDGENGKLQPAALRAALAKSGRGNVHHVQPAALSLTQATECGTVYSPQEVADLCKIAKEYDLSVHMDGARFANALATLGCNPADVTCDAGVDVLSFGATKNGAMSVEAVVFFDQEKAAEFEFRRKRGAHLFSKARYLSAQLDRYVQGNLWLDLAQHANEMATRLAAGLTAIKGCAPIYPVEANIIFSRLNEQTISALQQAGILFYVMDAEVGESRLVTSWNTTAEEVDKLLDIVASNN